MAAGWSMGALGVCPVVKSHLDAKLGVVQRRLVLPAPGDFLCDRGHLREKEIAFPLIVIGLNSIVAYCLAHVFRAFSFNSLRRIFGAGVFSVFGDAYYPLIYGLAVLVCLWLALFIMYQRKLFVRI